MFRRITRSISPSAQREERIFYLFILPWLIGLIVFNAGPVFGMLGLSFIDWRISLDDLQFIGLDNYSKLFADPIFWTSVGNTLYIVVGRVVFGTSFALLLAILLNQKVPGIPFFRAVYYLPTVTAGVAVALVVFASWRPGYVLAGAYLFGGVTIAQFHLQGTALASQLLSMLPYLATIAVLVVISRSGAAALRHMPASLGTPFHPER